MKKILTVLALLPYIVYSQVVTDLAPGNNVSVTIPATNYSSYMKAVILLHPVYDTALIGKNYTVGTLVALRDVGYDRTSVASLNTSSCYSYTYGSITSVDNYISTYPVEQWKLKKVRYNGILYLAIDVPYRNYQHNSGFRFTGWMASTEPDQLKMIPYYHTRDNAVLNEEVYTTLEDYEPNNAEYHHYHKSVFSGKVGIGTDTPDAELSVNGHIHTKEVKVDLDGWSDFVFEEGYDLPTLQEVEAHIRENGHLQDIPAAKEVAENGIRIGEMNAKLLQKIEELMLYTIAQEKRIQRLESEIVQLKKQ